MSRRGRGRRHATPRQRARAVSRARRNPTLSAAEREILERLRRRAEDTGDDWGITQAVADYLADPEVTESPERYLVAVDQDVGYHLGHVWEGPEDDESAARARASIHEATIELRKLRAEHPRRVAQALDRINAHRRQLLMPPLAAGAWTDEDVLVEDRRLAGNPEPPEPPPDADDDAFIAWIDAVAARRQAGVDQLRRRIEAALARGEAFSTPNAFARGGTTVVHASAKGKPGVALQLTWMDEDGPVGDTEPPSTQAAAERVWEDLTSDQRDALVDAATRAGNPARAIGYKVMPVLDGLLVSGADRRQRFPLRRGAVLRMPGAGIYLSPQRDYVLTYYSELAPVEALLTLEFDPDAVLTGNLADREPEVSVREATILDFQILEHPEDNPAARRGPGTPPKRLADYVRLSDLDATYLATYFGPDGEALASSRETPAAYPDLPPGTWMIDQSMQFPWGREIYELVEFSPRELEPSEFSWDDPKAELTWGGKWRDVQRYASWLKEGLRPPPILVVQSTSGTLRVVNGHRRLAAADIAGVPVRAWVSWLVQTPEHGTVGLTYELATGRRTNPHRPLDVRTQIMHIDMVGDQHQYWIVATLPGQDTRYGRMVLSVWRDEVHVDHVWVLAEARRRGIATELYRALYAFAQREGLRVEHGMFTTEGADAWRTISARLGIPQNPRAEALSW